MSLLRVERVRKAFGSQPVLRDAELDIPSGAIVALLGPSGCGKTTLLRLVAGFEAADAGRITLGGTVMDAPGDPFARYVPAERRRIGYVPQEGTLFPHLTVARNVGFGLTRAERRSGRVEAALRLTGLTAFADRYPHQISGGQQQRTALARALAPNPRLVLLDEPFNALDLDLRRTVCAEVIATLRAAGATALLVTHDPQEAFASADHMAVMDAGVIVQSGPPETVYRIPATPAVARLTGEAIFLAAFRRGNVAETVLGQLPVLGTPALPDGPATALLRPEQLVAATPGGAGATAAIQAREFRGDHTLVTATLDGLTLRFRAGSEVPDTSAPTIRLAVRGPCVLFPVDTEKRPAEKRHAASPGAIAPRNGH